MLHESTSLASADLRNSIHAAEFKSTRWSVVLNAGDDGREEFRQALEQLCNTYWFPLYSFVRCRGMSHHDALDLTQGFFVHLLEKKRLSQASPELGRFRSFLLAAIQNFASTQWRKQAAIRRGGDVLTFSVADDVFEQQYAQYVSDHATAERIYEQAWVESLLSGVMLQLEQEYEVARKQAVFQYLCPWLTGNSNRTGQNEIAIRLNMSTSSVSVSLFRMRQRFGQLLRQAVSDTVADPSEVDDEIQKLMRLLCAG